MEEERIFASVFNTKKQLAVLTITRMLWVCRWPENCRDRHFGFHRWQVSLVVCGHQQLTELSEYPRY